ncbi:MAG TPA: hypothetical protein VNM90_07365 [Haliangium sp.]|nr:hypothetical protein [Haliangium sp.]
MATETRQHAFSVFQERVAPYCALHRLCWQGYIEARGHDGWLFAVLQQYYTVRAMQPLLSLASDMASAHPELRDYADWAHRHAQEERPRADGFRDDLVALGFAEEAICATIPEHEILGLLGAQFALVVSVHPAALLGFLYTVEAHPVQFGAIEALAARLDIPTSGLRTLLRHAEVDQSYGAEVLGLVHRFVDDPLCFEAMLTSAALFLSGWSQMFRRKSRVSRGECDD